MCSKFYENFCIPFFHKLILYQNMVILDAHDRKILMEMGKILKTTSKNNEKYILRQHILDINFTFCVLKNKIKKPNFN